MTRRRRVQKSGLQTHEFPASFGARRFPKGNEGKRVCSGYNRRRRLATRSSGKQQAERTAVRTAPIVCPEESPLVRPQAHTPVPERPDAPTTAREQGLQPYEFPASFGARRFPKSERKALWCARRRIPLPRRGLTRRLRRGNRACSPMGRSHFSFDSERKVCKRKPAARRLREKALYCPFLKEGVRNVARSIVG